MSQEQPRELDPRAQRAVDELSGTIAQRYPTASFEVSRATDDPSSIHLLTVVDVDDPDEVGDLVIDRVVELQVEEQIPIHVIPIRTPQRLLASLPTEGTRQQTRPRRTVPLLGRLPTSSR